jgi:hypothetical protein
MLSVVTSVITLSAVMKTVVMLSVVALRFYNQIKLLQNRPLISSWACEITFFFNNKLECLLLTNIVHIV